jgi:hypothetical protein
MPMTTIQLLDAATKKNIGRSMTFQPNETFVVPNVGDSILINDGSKEVVIKKRVFQHDRDDVINIYLHCEG